MEFNIQETTLAGHLCDLKTLPKMPLTEHSIKGLFSKVEAPAQVSHSSLPSHGHPLGKGAEESRGKVHSSRMEQDVQGKGLSSLHPCPQGSQSIRVTFSVGTGCPSFLQINALFQSLGKALSSDFFSKATISVHHPKMSSNATEPSAGPRKKGLRKCKRAALAFRNKPPRETSKCFLNKSQAQRKLEKSNEYVQAQR